MSGLICLLVYFLHNGLQSDDVTEMASVSAIVSLIIRILGSQLAKNVVSIKTEDLQEARTAAGLSIDLADLHLKGTEVEVQTIDWTTVAMSCSQDARPSKP